MIHAVLLGVVLGALTSAFRAARCGDDRLTTAPLLVACAAAAVLVFDTPRS